MLTKVLAMNVAKGEACHGMPPPPVVWWRGLGFGFSWRGVVVVVSSKQ